MNISWCFYLYVFKKKHVKLNLLFEEPSVLGCCITEKTLLEKYFETNSNKIHYRIQYLYVYTVICVNLIAIIQ